MFKLNYMRKHILWVSVIIGLLIGIITIKAIIAKKDEDSSFFVVKEELQNVRFLEEEQLLIVQAPTEDLFPNCRLELQIICFSESGSKKNIPIPDTPPFIWGNRYEVQLNYDEIADCQVKYCIYSDTNQIVESLISYKERSTYEN